jgi:hypothetical protein
MAKMVKDLAIDAMLDYIASNGSRITVNSSYSTDYATMSETTGNMLAKSTSAISSGSYTLQNGDTSGRKVTTPAQTDVSVAASGTASHVAIISTGLSAVILVTSCTTQSLTTGNTVTVPAFDDEVLDPS